MKIFISLLLVIVAASANAQTVDRIKIEEAGLNLQKYSKANQNARLWMVTGLGIATINVASKPDNIVPGNVVAGTCVATGIIISLASNRYIRIAGEKLEFADSGIGIKYRF